MSIYLFIYPLMLLVHLASVHAFYYWLFYFVLKAVILSEGSQPFVTKNPFNCKILLQVCIYLAKLYNY